MMSGMIHSNDETMATDGDVSGSAEGDVPGGIILSADDSGVRDNEKKEELMSAAEVFQTEKETHCLE